MKLNRTLSSCVALCFALNVFVGVFLSGLQLSAQSQSQSQTWQQIAIPKLPEFHPPQPKRIVLPNGMIIFLQEDHELPIIGGTTRIRGGERSVPAKLVGLTDVYGEVWRTGGTKTQTGDQLDDFLEQRAAKVETGEYSVYLPQRGFRRCLPSVCRCAAEPGISCR